MTFQEIVYIIIIVIIIANITIIMTSNVSWVNKLMFLQKCRTLYP